RISTDDSAPSLAALRHTEPKKLAALLRGELDWVVMKCLEKQRDRRYDTANGLARDIQRYLADEVVEARPPSTAYRLRKFGSRSRVQVVAAGLILLALVVGLITTVHQANRAGVAEKAAWEAARDADARRKDAERAEQVAQREYQRADAERRKA